MKENRFFYIVSGGFYKVKEDPQFYKSAYKVQETQLLLKVFTGENYCASEHEGDTYVELIGKIDKIQRTIRI